jgi:AcrR family transcriptional regulator
VSPSASATPAASARAAGAGADSADGADIAAPAESARRTEILAAAAEIFARKGYVNATVREIADASGILAGSLYHHFESKEAMVDEILSTFLADLLARYQAVVDRGDDPITTLRGLVDVMFEGLTENRAALTLAHNHVYELQQIPRFAYINQMGRQVEALWVGVLRAGIETGDLRADIDPPLVWAFIKGAVWSTVQYLEMWGTTSVPADHIADAYVDVLLGGIGTDR